MLAALAARSPPHPLGAARPGRPVDYSKPASWLCLPGRADICSTPLPTTALNPNGYGSTGQQPVGEGPADRLLLRLSDRSPRSAASTATSTPATARRTRVAAAQFARFAGVCRTFAPVYRSDDASALVAAVAAGADVKARIRIAYGDVRAAWREYLAKYNKGRPFVLIGHSQGSLDASELIANEIEGKPDRQADEAGDHPRLQRAGAAGQAGRRHLQVDADLLEAGPRPAAS